MEIGALVAAAIRIAFSSNHRRQLLAGAAGASTIVAAVAGAMKVLG